MPREKALACAVRLLDRGFFRIGSEDYAEENDTYGIATMRKRHVTVSGDEVTLRLRGQGRAAPGPDDRRPQVARLVRALKRRRGGGEELLAYKADGRWVDVKSADINDYVKEAAGEEFSAKDFRTWSGTVLAAVALAVSGPARGTKTSRKRAKARAVKEVARYLGNTPTVARASYIDPRVFDRFDGGLTIAGVLPELAEDTARLAGPAGGDRGGRARPDRRRPRVGRGRARRGARKELRGGRRLGSAGRSRDREVREWSVRAPRDPGVLGAPRPRPWPGGSAGPRTRRRTRADARPSGRASRAPGPSAAACRTAAAAPRGRSPMRTPRFVSGGQIATKRTKPPTPPPKRGKPMFTRQPVAGTPDRSATPSACAKPLCISQASPSSVGVESVSSGSWPWKRMCRLRCRNISASSETPGNSVSGDSAGSGQRLDQSERTNTTLPAGMRPWRRSQRRMSDTWSA